MNVRKTFYTKNFDDYVKSCKTFYLNTGKTVNFSLNHIRMATQFSGPKTFTWNIFFSIELPFQNLLEVLIEEKLENFREFREGFTFDFRRKSLYIEVHCWLIKGIKSITKQKPY